MPADNTLQVSKVVIRDSSSKPYDCSKADLPPGANWPGLQYGYCRTSLDWHEPSMKKDGALMDNPQGAGDPRCPGSCPHKAPLAVAQEFMQRWGEGLVVLTQFTREHRAQHPAAVHAPGAGAGTPQAQAIISQKEFA